ncbi:LexA family transcriptional repressor [Candidatus Peregrinibacteria bacterium CG_4_10_14_0_2_um_filter_43_11]|nr:MAG: LexA family transcriptional repressor [Candidatus Peregrinibacteria bacterium CG_4_10_14_0_2_um_filter_43_11]
MIDELKSKINRIRHFYRQNKIMPTYDELCYIFGFKSKNAAFRLVGKLVAKGFVEKMDKGRLKPGPNLLGMPIFSSVQAGLPTAEEETVLDHVDLNDYLISKPEKTVMINVRGDSMIDAGIHEGDKVIVECGSQIQLGNIVVAIVDGNYTVKYFDQTPEGKIVLQPGNPKYEPIIPREELQIFGKVIGVIRKM